MSFGFQVFDASNGPILDDKAFSITGRSTTLSGSGTFSVGNEFVALGVSGGALVGKDLLWYVGAGRVYYNILNGAALNVIIYERRSTANPKYGLEIFSASGEKTFSSGDRHFEVISQSLVWNVNSHSSEPLNTETIYILHSLSYTIAERTNTPRGFQMGLDSLSADSQTIYAKTRVTHFYQGEVLPYVLDQVIANNPSSKLLRVRAK